MIGPEVSAKLFKMIATRKIPEAEQALEKIRAKLDQSKDNLGYLRALEGLILTEKSSDENLFLNRANLNEKSIKEMRQEFHDHASNELHEEYDRGYFRALADYVKCLDDEKIWEQLPPPTQKKLDEIKEEIGASES
jgi:uncharacterized membrane-anchored protein YjiN (DUF445 family)